MIPYPVFSCLFVISFSSFIPLTCSLFLPDAFFCFYNFTACPIALSIYKLRLVFLVFTKYPTIILIVSNDFSLAMRDCNMYQLVHSCYSFSHLKLPWFSKMHLLHHMRKSGEGTGNEHCWIKLQWCSRLWQTESMLMVLVSLAVAAQYSSILVAIISEDRLYTQNSGYP